MNRIPRFGTRRRAVYDALRAAQGNPVDRATLKQKYMDVEPKRTDPRGVELTFNRTLHLYAVNSARGMWTAKDWVTGKVEKLQEIPVMEDVMVEVVRPGVPPLNAAPPANAAIPIKVDPPAAAKPQAEAPPPPKPEVPKRAADEQFHVGDVLRFTSESGAGHPDAVEGNLYKATSVEPRSKWAPANSYMVDAVAEDGSGTYIRCYARRFELVTPAEEKAVEPPKRKFYKGERIAYIGGYNYLDTRGYKAGDLFTVKSYGDVLGQEKEDGEYLFLEETPATDGHPEASFRAWPEPDEEIKCHCGAVSWGKARTQNPFPHLLREWAHGFRKTVPAADAGLHFLNKPCELKNGLQAFKRSMIEDMRQKLATYRATIIELEGQVQTMHKGLEEILKQLEGGQNLPNPKR